MPTSEQPNQPPHHSEEGLEAMENLTSEAEALGVSEADLAATSVEQADQLVAAEETSDESGEAPFLGFEQDPGIENLTAEGETEEAPEPVVYRELAGPELQAAVEATFFMHHKPISVARLRELINPGIAEEDYRTAISNLMATYFDENRGIELVEVANGYQLRTKAEHKDIVRRMYQIAPMKLTNAMLEVLAITAYNQPLTREGIDRIRGVDSSHLLRVLLDKKMLRIVGKSDEIGRPMIYGTTKEFLELFGLRDLSSLPSLRDIEDMLPKNEVGGEISEEELLAKEMEGIVDASKPLEFNDLEMDDLNETPKIEPAQPNVPSFADSDSGAQSHGASSPGAEAGNGDGDLHFAPEAAGRLPLGPEGNA